MSPNINDYFPSTYLKASDIRGHEPVVTIDRVEYEPVGRNREMKAVLYFRGKDKGIVLNKTNANKIVELSGSAVTEEWGGVRLRLFATETQFGGETVECIRIKSPDGTRPIINMSRAPRQAARPTPSPAPPAAPVEEYDDSAPLEDDEIPF